MRGAALVPLIVVGLAVAAFVFYVVLPKTVAALGRLRYARQHEEQRRAESSRRAREAQTRRWLAARPTGTYRREVIEVVIEAYVDERLTLAEHHERIALVMEATTNRQVQDAVADLEVVEKPE